MNATEEGLASETISWHAWSPAPPAPFLLQVSATPLVTRWSWTHVATSPRLDSTNHSICGQTKNECQKEYILHWTEINSLQQCQMHSDKPPAGIIPKTTYILQQHEVADCTLSPLISWLTRTFFACSRCQPCPIPVVTSCSWSVCMWSDHLQVSSSWFLYSVYHAGA